MGLRRFMSASRFRKGAKPWCFLSFCSNQSNRLARCKNRLPGVLFIFIFTQHLTLPCVCPFPARFCHVCPVRLQNDPPSGVTGAPMDTNIMLWQAVIFGPDDTPWEGGTFKLVLEFSEDYPNKAPQVRFLTKMFHPNIYNDGQICLDILQNQWSPIYDISAILTSIQSLLCDPNPASPANSEASRLYNENRREYNRRVREIVEQSWIDES